MPMPALPALSTSGSDPLSRVWRGLRTLNLAALGLLPHPARFKAFLLEVERRYSTYAYAPVQSIELQEVAPADLSDIYLPLQHSRRGSSAFFDLAALAVLAQAKRPRQVFEIGTFEGLTSAIFAVNAGAASRVITLDLPPDRTDIQRTDRSYTAHSIATTYESGHLIARLGAANQVMQVFGDSALFDFAPYHGQIDLFFIDGAHTEDYVATDTLNAFQCLTSEGWVVWHDCLVPQVLAVLKQVAQHVPVKHIQGTNVAFAPQAPPGVSSRLITILRQMQTRKRT